MTGQSLVARESEILDVLGALYELRENFALIGGYAVDAYSTLPRYSVDCDLVIASAQLTKFTSFLDRRGYKQEDIYQNETEGVETRRLVKRIGNNPVFVDLLIGGVRCRQTEAVWEEEEIKKTSKELRVVSVSGSVLSNVSSREILIATKLHSGRDPDLRDVVMLGSGVDWKMVGNLSRRGSRVKVVSQLESAVEILARREFAARLKAYFGMRAAANRRVGSVLYRVNQLRMEVARKNVEWIGPEQR